MNRESGTRSRPAARPPAGHPRTPLTRSWTPARPVDLGELLGPLRRGSGDPCLRTHGDAYWWATNTDEGPGTLALRRHRGAVLATAWGPGAARLVEGLPALCGAEDDDGGFVAHHPAVALARRTLPGLRLCSTGRVWDVLLAAVLEQKVTSTEAWRSWRELARRFGGRAPGPDGVDLRVPPDPARLRSITDWQWHQCGVDGARRRTLLAVAGVASRLERAVELGGAEGRALLRVVPGVGEWTAAEVAQRAWGDPDAVSVGDYHLSNTIGWALLGRRVDDAGMLALLAPYAGQRHRAVRYLTAVGSRAPRRGPRLSPRDYRAC